MEAMELGIYTFVEVAGEPGTTVAGDQRLRDLMEEIALADQVGLDVFGIGEHHRPDFAVSAPAVARRGAHVGARVHRRRGAGYRLA